MCGRFTLTFAYDNAWQDFAKIFGLDQAPDYPSRYNIAPGQEIATITQDAKAKRQLQQMRWGLIPSWAKDPAIANKLINARGETISEKPSFRNAFKRRRCLIPADGFYEWQRIEKRKQPYYFYGDQHQSFAIAGLWEHWASADGSEIHTCTIITTAANSLMEPIHDRMPVILEPVDYDLWLQTEPSDLNLLQTLLKPYPTEHLHCHSVSPKVNRPQFDDPDCIQPQTITLA